MADFSKSIPIILRHEGGWVKDPADPGGATNRGIILKLFVQQAKSLGLLPTEDALKNLTEAQARLIYLAVFWNRIMGDKINNQSIADLLLDSIVNLDELKIASGDNSSTAVKFLQRALHISDDGIFGGDTLAQLNVRLDARPIFDSLKSQRIDYYNNLVARKPTLQKFLASWLKRVNSFNFTA